MSAASSSSVMSPIFFITPKTDRITPLAWLLISVYRGRASRPSLSREHRRCADIEDASAIDGAVRSPVDVSPPVKMLGHRESADGACGPVDH
jgi:hypothetical protein